MVPTDETGSNKKAGQQHLWWQTYQCQVDGGIDAAHHLRRVGKGSGEYKDPDHQHHLSCGGTPAEGVDAFLQGTAVVNDDGKDARHHEGDGDGHLIEVARDDAGD